MVRNRLGQFLLTPFLCEKGIHRALVAVFVVINGIVLFNAICHDPGVGYDAPGYRKYMVVLSEFRLPTRDDTREFFSPPLPYLAPSLLYASGMVSIWQATKFSQLLNVLFSVGLTFYLIKICDITRPNNPHLKITSLALLGMVPVYYKTFSFVRGEPLLVFLSVFVVYQTVIVFVKKNSDLRDMIVLGVSLGLLILARQSGFSFFPAIILFAAMLTLKRTLGYSVLLKAITVTLAVAFVVGGWYYVYLYKEYGTARAFNRAPSPTFSFSNQPREFYFGLGLDKLFSDPIRDSFRNQFLPTFYSDTWGDYWCYFVVYGRDIRDGQFVPRLYEELSENPLPWWLQTNRYDVAPHLGRVNLLALFPSMILLAGVLLGTVRFGRFVVSGSISRIVTISSLLYLIIVLSLVTYLCFLIMYPSGKGDTIKPTYMLYVFPFAAILAGELLQRIRRRSVHAYRAMWALLLISVVHNSPVLITRYIPWS